MQNMAAAVQTQKVVKFKEFKATPLPGRIRVEENGEVLYKKEQLFRVEARYEFENAIKDLDPFQFNPL